MFNFDDMTEDEGDNALDDWYDKALRDGFGFKSEKEKQDYIASIGDPMKHPLFARTTEDLEGHPLTEAFRCLREDDKTNVGLAEMYKEEGNEWMKKSDKKSLSEAYIRYSHALTFVDKADAARADFSDAETEDRAVDLKKLRSVILSNRALASLNITNYGKCYKDCDKAISLYPSNMKAHYRKCKALMTLKKYPDCIAACGAAEAAAATADPVIASPKDILTIKQHCEKMLSSAMQTKKASQARQLAEMLYRWREVWDIASSRRICLGYPTYGMQEPRELRESWMMVDPDYAGDSSATGAGTGTGTGTGAVSESTPLCLPVLLQYPQYGTYDVLTSAGYGDMLVDHLAQAFPEKEDLGPGQQLVWDVAQEYQVSNLVVYVQLFASRAVGSLREWVDACMEQKVLLMGGNMELLSIAKHLDFGSGESSSAKDAAAAGKSVSVPELPKNSVALAASLAAAAVEAHHSSLHPQAKEASLEVLKSKAEARERAYWEKLFDTATGRSATLDASTGSTMTANAARFLEVHLGCSLGQIAKAHFPAHTLPRGVLTLLVYPKGSRLHKLFVEQNKDRIVPLTPFA
jgi:hypothetical protein